MKSNELRIGSIIEYNNDGEFLLNKVDWQDLKWITENPDGFNLVHRPIPITEVWLERLGFKSNERRPNANEYRRFLYTSRSVHISITVNKEEVGSNDNYHRTEIGYNIISGAYLKGIRYVHELQNLFIALTGVELVEDYKLDTLV